MSETVVNPENVNLVENTDVTTDVTTELKRILKEKATTLLKEKLQVEKLNETVIIQFVILVMELVEDTEIKGKSQKELVLYVVNEIINIK